STDIQYWDPTRTRWAPDEYQRLDQPIELPDDCHHLLIRARDANNLNGFGMEVLWLERGTPVRGLPVSLVEGGRARALDLSDVDSPPSSSTVASASGPPSDPPANSQPPTRSHSDSQPPTACGGVVDTTVPPSSPLDDNPPSYASTMARRGCGSGAGPSRVPPMIDLRSRQLRRSDSTFYGEPQQRGRAPHRQPQVPPPSRARTASPMETFFTQPDRLPTGRGVKRQVEEDVGEGPSTEPKSKRPRPLAAPAFGAPASAPATPPELRLGTRQRRPTDRAAGIELPLTEQMRTAAGVRAQSSASLIAQKQDAARAYAQSSASLRSAAPRYAAPWSRTPPRAAPAPQAPAFGRPATSGSAFGRPATPAFGASASTAAGFAARARASTASGSAGAAASRAAAGGSAALPPSSMEYVRGVLHEVFYIQDDTEDDTEDETQPAKPKKRHG
ncbi:hypothetical protein FA95DRAFT_130087, partial [Auriscalpium vulgare]